MTVTYLNQSASVKLDLFGRGSVDLKPPVGQYWAPKFVRVSTLNQQSPVAYCVVYQGAVTIKNQTTFLDDTLLGSGDTSSIISGTLLRYGEAITAVWDLGNAFDTAILTIWGTVSDVPPQVEDQMPSVPGTHFTGKPAPELTLREANVTGFPAPGGTNFAVGMQAFGTIPTSPVADVRNFGSYYFQLDTQVITPTKYNPITVIFTWWSDNLQGVGGGSTYIEEVSIWAAGSTGAFINGGGTLYMQDVHHGPYLTVNIINPAGNDTVSLFFRLVGSSRSLPGPYHRQVHSDGTPGVNSGQGADGFLIDKGGIAIGGGGTVDLPMLMGYGDTQWTIVNAGAAAMTYTITYAGHVAGHTALVPTLAAGGNTMFNFTMPKRAGLIRVTGTAAQLTALRVVRTYSSV